MNRCPGFAHHVAVGVFQIADAIAHGGWCFLCGDFKGELCDAEGSCQKVEFETQVEHEAFQHWPSVDFGGGD